MTLWKWTKGRQNTGYSKMLLAGWTPYFDLYLIKFREGCDIPIHRDPVPGRKHYRLNWVFWRAKFGGTFVCEARKCPPRKRVHFFRPDAHYHAQTRILKGSQYMLSLGWTVAI